MGESLVDIGIPVFRRADYLAQAVRSVLAQSYEHWRLTISEDAGSSEAVRRAVEPYLDDPRIEYVSADEHLGLARHKSSLVASGQGKYVALLDDDDLWLPGWLERRVEFLERHGQCVLVWGGHLDIDTDGAELARSRFPLPGGVCPSREFVRRMMDSNIVSTPSVLLRRDAYVRAGNAFDPSFVHINDYELWLRMGTIGAVGFLAVHDCGYRVHPAQMSRRHDRALDHLRLIDHLDELLLRTDLDLRLPAAARRHQKAERLLSAALDAAEQGQTRTAARRIRSAAGLAPRALGSRRGLGAIAATVGGRNLARRIGARRP
ncbi:MAG TPA: glycosyltransferase [Solirubrobacteraceae bacterium]|nr:glycosyltransferase [Solirubrobacteraceae bacterium]